MRHLQRMPAPSPVFFSQPQAPRCSRFSRIWSALLDDVVRLAALQVDDEADAAGVVLVLGVVEALRAGEELLSCHDFREYSQTAHCSTL